LGPKSNHRIEGKCTDKKKNSTNCEENAQIVQFYMNEYRLLKAEMSPQILAILGQKRPENTHSRKDRPT
jgi:hypothetical protein